MKIVYPFVIFCLLSCGKEAQPLAKDKMVEILVDVHIAEGLTNSHHALTLRDSLESLYLNQILEKHQLEKGNFEEAMAHLHGDPQLLDEVYKAVLQELANMTLRIDDEEAKRRDAESNYRSRN